MAAGVMSSWLMIVPAGVLAGCLGIEAMRGRSKLGPAVAIGIVFAALAALSLIVFTEGSRVAPEIGAEDLRQQMFAEMPTGRSPAMALPIALAVAWLAKNHDRLAPRFVALSLLAVPAAVYLAHRHSHVAGGYYVGLVTPMLLYAAAVATARATKSLADAAARGGFREMQSWVPTVVAGTIATAVAVATIGGSGPGPLPDATEYLKDIAHHSRVDPLPIYTNRTDLPRLLAFERARAGEEPLTPEAAQWGPPDLRARVLTLERGACPPAPDSTAAGFYVAYFGDRSARYPCLELLGSQCRNLLPALPHGRQGAWLVLRCDGAARPPPL